ncbi:TonB-dependent receptor domain-containing protein [Oleisolibacter albus]|uniref:TonB-dependent receptor domain-containing protein n=1 Tax=Oleisolibacter albus TaxID=2171757 RepID=UPI000DF3BBD7|nr:TonB-dependent receptor [Oleisolibacter albus]
MTSPRSTAGSRALLLAGAALVSLALPAVAQAQDALEEIVVTGSRIARPNLTAPSPVTVVDSEALLSRGTTNPADYLNQLPSLGVPSVSSTNSNFTTTAAGLNLINLRNLGTERTLVLVNGRRHVGGTGGSNAVDINSIPSDLIERIDVVTGGASAVYGSEAVAGVVNFVLKDNFEGVKAGVQYGVTDEGDGQNVHAYSLIGANMANGRGNVALNVGYDKTDSIKSKDRSFSSVDTTRGATGKLTRPAYSYYGKDGLFYYNIPGSTTGETTDLYNPDGTLFNRTANGYNRDQDRLIQVPTERYLVSTNAHYDLTDNVRWFFEGTYARTEGDSQQEPITVGDQTQVGFGPSAPYLSVPRTNPFIPQAIKDLAPDANEPVQFERRFSELGLRRSDFTRQTFRFATGFEGDLIPDTSWKYNTYYSYGKVTEAQTSTGVYNTQRMAQALDATTINGQIVCADAAARAMGCAPINLFGAGKVSQAALDYVRASSNYDADIKQQVGSLSFTGDVVELPAGPVGVAFGGEWRKEASSTEFDPLTLSGLSSGNQAANTKGSYRVWEGFGEVNVPLLADMQFVKYLGVDAAVRYSDYSTVGSLWSYKGGAEYAPIDDVRFRATYARAVRAPNISELFDPAQQTFSSVSDPCADDTRNANATRAANCAATPGVREAIAAGGFKPGDKDLISIPGFNSGNPNLDAEKADTWTIGAVFTPTFVHGLAVTVDYWDIKIKDAIQGIDRQTAVEQCVDQAQGANNLFCSLVQRDPVTGLITGLDARQMNVATQKAAGIDVQVDYTLELGDFSPTLDDSTLHFNLVGTYLDKNTSTAFAGATPIDDAGQVGYSRYKANLRTTYNQGPLSASWLVRYIGAANMDNTKEFKDNRIPAIAYHDVQVSYTLAEKYQLYVGVNNLLDRNPPIIGGTYAVNVTGTETAADVYDVTGRFFYTGIRASF